MLEKINMKPKLVEFAHAQVKNANDKKLSNHASVGESQLLRKCKDLTPLWGESIIYFSRDPVNRLLSNYDYKYDIYLCIFI